MRWAWSLQEGAVQTTEEIHEERYRNMNKRERIISKQTDKQTQSKDTSKTHQEHFNDDHDSCYGYLIEERELILERSVKGRFQSECACAHASACDHGQRGGHRQRYVWIQQ